MSTRKWLFGFLFIGTVVVVTFMLFRRLSATEHRRYSSPDGRFQIVVFRFPMFFAMPGQGSDAPGYFQLLDTRTGRVLREQKVGMVQEVDQIHWSATNVVGRIFADWSLPK